MIVLDVDILTPLIPPSCRDPHDDDDVIDSRTTGTTPQSTSHNRVPKFVKQFLKNLWNTGHSGNNTCTVCLEEFNNAHVTKEDVRGICHGIQETSDVSMDQGNARPVAGRGSGPPLQNKVNNDLKR